MERFASDKIPDGWVSIEFDQFAEIISPLFSAMGKREVNLAPNTRHQIEVDATIDGMKITGNLNDFSAMSDGAWALLKEKISIVAASAAHANSVGHPFMICPRAIRSNKERLLVDLILKEFRSPESKH